MHLRRSAIRTFTPAVPMLVALLCGLAPRPASAVPPAGFTEHFPGTSLQGWGGGSLYDNPGSGGVGGAGDGYLLFSTPSPFHLGTVNLDPPYPGNWLTSGLEFMKVSLKDVGADNPLSIHFILANSFTIYQSVVGFDPPQNQWTEYTLTLTNANFVRILGTQSFNETLASVDRIHFRHDLPPFIHQPDQIQGDVGMDRLIFSNAATPTQSSSWGRIKSLYR